MPRHSIAFGASALLAACLSCAAQAAEPPDARAILQDMARNLAQASAFSVQIDSAYDAIQADGQHIEFAERRQVRIQRPAHLRVDVTRSDGESGFLLYDGHDITVYKARDDVYGMVPVAGTVDNAVLFAVRDLQMTIPLARMLVTTLPEDLHARMTAASYVETNVLSDVPLHHIAARGAEVDMQIWVTVTEPVLPRRVVITYKTEPGQPRFTANLSGWDLKPTSGADTFAWNPPKGAEQVPLLASPMVPAPAVEGGAK